MQSCLKYLIDSTHSDPPRPASRFAYIDVVYVIRSSVRTAPCAVNPSNSAPLNMVHSRIIRVSRDLHFAPSLPPHPDSLEWVAHGSLSRGFVDPSLPVAPSIAAALETALRFAHQLILHPVGLHHAAMLLGHNNAPDALIAKAIRRVLSTRRWTICLDKGIGAGKALHCSPTRLTLPVSASESTLFFGLEVRVCFAYRSSPSLMDTVGAEAE